ncbi:ATP-NAD kinase-like domain-containing protein [Chaetomium tenue]|uniref:ATP-NAD kinase-like domain-containing protein n=1 Tax=Chaetomium tenue TaxID=1854479 RepID=A0ACB7PB30_9PEZI|nr:ATP-NAD kinase-like domain-containing protein [Chaetomium globosum]
MTAQHVSSAAGESPDDAVSKIKREEVVLVVPRDNGSGYLIYSLVEGSASDGEKPLKLEVVQCEQHQLPEDLSRFLLSQGSLPPTHLSPPREVHVVVSTHSGLKLASEFYQGVLRPLLGSIGLEPSEARVQGGYQATVTESSDTIRDFAQGLGRDGNATEKTVILLSGDGGVTDFLNGQDRGSPPPDNALLPTIALLPLGTGNALFHSLHKPLYATTTTTTTNPAPSPLSDTPAYRVHGAKRFAMAAGELLKVGHVYEVGVGGGEGAREVEGKGGEGGNGGKSGGGFNYVLATLVSNLEKTFAISPESRPLDGRLRLVHFGDVGGAKTMEIMMAAYREGEHVGMPEVGYEDVDEVKVTVAEEDPRWRKVCVDGSIVELEKGGWMRVGREGRERVNILVDAAVAR